MGLSIIANNCCGVRLLEDLNVRWDSPTIAVQIMPEEYTKFCQNIKWYMEQDIKEYKDFSEEHVKYFAKMYGGGIDFVVGLCGDVAIVFQHYDTWAKAKEKWDKRKARIDYDNLNFLFCLDYEKYKNEAQKFANAQIPNSFIFTRDFDIEGKHYRYHVPEVNPYNPDRPYCFLDKDKPNHYFFEGEWERGLLKWGNS